MKNQLLHWYPKRVMRAVMLVIGLLLLILVQTTETIGEVTFKEVFYKNECSSIEEYQWSEILIEKNHISVPSTYTSYGVTYSYDGFKSFESSSLITYGKAGEINRMAKTNEDGLKMVNGRYLVAIGTRFGVSVGQYFDLVLKNGVVIPCIMGDTKADEDTDNSNTMTVHSKCVSEFIVSQSALPESVAISGDVSVLYDWDAPVVEVIVYENSL